MAHHRRDRWTTGDRIALAVGVVGGGALYLMALAHLVDWLAADVLRMGLALAVLAGVVAWRLLTALLTGLIGTVLAALRGR